MNYKIICFDKTVKTKNFRVPQSAFVIYTITYLIQIFNSSLIQHKYIISNVNEIY